MMEYGKHFNGLKIIIQILENNFYLNNKAKVIKPPIIAMFFIKSNIVFFW